MNENSQERLYIIDGNSYIYRAFFAIRGLSTSYGLPTNAVFGFASMLLKVIKEKAPELLAIAFDPKGPTRRHAVFALYKAQRPPMPKDLVPQIPYIHRLVSAFRIPVFMIDGQEADDVIATLASRAYEKGMDVTIVTGDKDIMQLIRPGITVYDTLKDKVYGPAEVQERFGVPPEKMVEIMGLMGDAVDNIPGVPGIGEKTARALVEKYGSIENILAHADEITKPKLRQSLIESADIARKSRELAALITDLPIDIDFDKLRRKEPDAAALMSLFRELEFTSLLKHVSRKAETRAEYSTVVTEDDFRNLLSRLRQSPEISIDTETTSTDPIRAGLVGISFSLEPGRAWYIPIGHRYQDVPRQLDRDTVLAGLKPILEDPGIKKIGQNLKYDFIVFKRHGINMAGISFDTMIASYVINPGRPSHSLEAIALEYLDYKVTTYEDVTGSGKGQRPFEEVDIETATRYAGEDADIVLRLKRELEPRLKEHGLEVLFRDIEMPLMEVLADIELTGVKIDAGFLHDLSRRLEAEIEESARSIYEMAGTEFNINSPKQLADILFGKIGLRPSKRTKTGFSTNVDVLEELSHIHPLPGEILNYRSLVKLKSTYIDALPALINPETGRLHTSLNQTVTATGRLSSSDPNLQNIPIRTETGREIRKAFIPEEGCSILSADYSQIELRILAHLSNDPGLIATFRQDEDVHTRTASEIFGLPIEEITAEMRRKAKAVNFGIIYGISAFGLAQNIGVSNTEAKRYIDGYFERYPKVREFIDRTIEEARTKGYVTTLFGRRRFIPELSSSAAALRASGERAAVNTPIQGTAADMIKIAMIRIHRRLKQEGLSARIILQIHDELVLEVPNAEIDTARHIVRDGMENVAELSVPVKVDMGVGRNWDEAH